jgi:class 3 adenylate cyclase/ActR/RegA family two-component response regulator
MQSRKILVIDDEVMVADVSKSILTHTGHQVYCAFSGEQAVQLAMETCFDLAIIDALLPGMNGIETFEIIRQICPHTKGILLSGELTVSMVITAMEKGFSKVLAKPLRAGLLSQIVEATLAETKLREENICLQKQVLQMRSLLGQYLAPEVATILLDRKEPVSELSGGVQEITVLFADIRNFTFLVQHLPLQEAQTFLTNFFDMIADVVASWNGTLDKFIGDAALALFGAPVEQETPSLSAVSAAIEIQRNFEKLRNQWVLRSELFSQIGLGIGISRGPMYLGDVGSGRRLDFTVIGADVNIAQRLASETTAGQILVTESVYHDVAAHCSIQEEKNRLLRGVEKTIQLYSITP